jgi:MFS family permease
MNRYCLAIGIASAAIYSVLVPISAATGLSVGDLNSGTGYMFLTFGWGCLIWQPLAQKFGKRPVYLLSLLGTTVSLSLLTCFCHNSSSPGNHDLGPACNDQRPMDCQQGPPRDLWCPSRVTLRNLGVRCCK